MNYQTSNVKTGGGCRPKGINDSIRSWSERIAEAIAKRKAEQDAWLLTPEGVAYQEKVNEEAAKVLQGQEARRVEDEKREAWRFQVSTILANKPAVNAVVSTIGGQEAQLFLKKVDGKYIAWCLLRCEESNRNPTQYPDLPVWHLAASRRFGLKLFFDWPSIQELFAFDPDAKASVDTFVPNAEYESHYDLFDTRYEDNGERTVNAKVHSVKILGYAQSGKSARVAIVK